MAADVDHKYEFGSLGIAVGSIWTAVLAISVLSPDLVSGSEQQHLPVAALATWIWGMVATSAVFTLWMTTHRAGPTQLYQPFAVAVVLVWLVATGVSVFGPEMVTGSDPTRVPLCAILAPIAATMVTWVVATVFKTLVNEDARAAS